MWLNRRRVAPICEGLLATVVCGSVIWAVDFLFHVGMLPQPYFHGANDTLMDLISVAYWSHNPGAYYAFNSVYPPLTFDFLRIISLPSCYRFDGLFARDCDWLIRLVFCSFFFINIPIVFRAYELKDSKTAIFRTLAMCFGLPMLFAMERGNVVIPCFTFFVLGNSQIIKSARLKWLALAISINFKPYLITSIFSHFVRRRWRWFEGAVISGLIVYLVTYFIEGVGTPTELVTNITGYAYKNTAITFDNAYYASSYNEIMASFKTTFPFIFFIGSEPLKWMEVIFPLAIRAGQLGVICCFMGSLWKPDVLPLYRLTALSVAFIISASDAGGYSQIFLIFLVFMEKWRGMWMITALVSCYLLSISGDVALLSVARQMDVSWLTNRVVGYDLGLNLGELARPGIILLIEYVLVGKSITDLWQARRSRRRVGYYYGNATTIALSP